MVHLVQRHKYQHQKWMKSHSCLPHHTKLNCFFELGPHLLAVWELVDPYHTLGTELDVACNGGSCWGIY